MSNKNDLLAVLQVLKKYNLKVNFIKNREELSFIKFSFYFFICFFFFL